MSSLKVSLSPSSSRNTSASHYHDHESASSTISDVEAKARRADALLSKFGQRENEIAEQLESRLTRFDVKPTVSARSQQLLQADPLQSLNRGRGIGPPEPGGVSLTQSPRSKRVAPLGPIMSTKPTKPW